MSASFVITTAFSSVCYVSSFCTWSAAVSATRCFQYNSKVWDPRINHTGICYWLWSWHIGYKIYSHCKTFLFKIICGICRMCFTQHQESVKVDRSMWRTLRPSAGQAQQWVSECGICRMCFTQHQESVKVDRSMWRTLRPSAGQAQQWVSECGICILSLYSNSLTLLLRSWYGFVPNIICDF